MTASPPSAAIRPFVPVERIGDVVPDVPLIDQHGRRISLRAAVLPTIVAFAYTRCPDPTMCSLVTAKFAVMQRLLRGSGIRLVEVTLDPVYDRQSVLNAYAGAAGARSPSWSLVTGDPTAVVTMEERFGVVFERSNTSAIGHTDLVAFVSRDGTILNRIDGAGWSPASVVAEARALAALPSSPIQRVVLRLMASAGAACSGRGGGISVIAAVVLFFLLAASIAAVALRLLAQSRPKGSSS